MNLLREAHARKDPLEVLQDIYDSISEQFKVVEEINDKLFKSLDSSDCDYENVIEDLELYITNIERVKNETHSIIAKAMCDEKLTVSDLPKLRKQRLTPPDFTGRIREYPTFRKVYERLMKPVYDDPYVLRSCLSGEALDVV